MAEAVAEGAGSIDGATAVLKPAADASIDDLSGCAGLVIGSPEYFGYMSGAVKDFFDRTYEAAQTNESVFRKPYALFINAGNDGTGALTSIERICLGYKFKRVFEPIVVTGGITDEVVSACRELGKTIAAGCVMEIY